MIACYISVIAEKEGFVITGPDVKGGFLAHKLAEIIVQVSDHADGSSLQVSHLIKHFKKQKKRKYNNIVLF